MHRRDDFSGQDRRFSRARQERKDKGESHRGHLAAGTAMVLFPIGAPGQPPARWLLFVSAVEACNDQHATRLSPGEAYILSQHKG